MLMNSKCAFVYLFELFISPKTNEHNAIRNSILNFNLLRGVVESRMITMKTIRAVMNVYGLLIRMTEAEYECVLRILYVI